jgi:glucose/mannose-6-phosphate isomerase
LLSGKRPAPEVVRAEGESLIEQLMWVIALGDFVSLYLAFLNGINPTPVDLLDKFKAAMNE